MTDLPNPADSLTEEEKQLVRDIIQDSIKLARLRNEIKALRQEAANERKREIVKEVFSGMRIRMHTLTRDAGPEAHRMQVDDIKKDIKDIEGKL